MSIKRINTHRNLGELVDSFQSVGKYVVLRDEALSLIGCSIEALKKAVGRLRTTPTGVSKTETGNMIISTPEATALDLVRYLEGVVGHLNHVATTLSELAS